MKAVKYITLFALVIVVLNVAGGLLMKHLFNQSLSGESGGKVNCYMNDSDAAPVLIMGSSRAAGNLDPKLFEKRAFNIAHNGMYDVFQLNLLNVLIEQNKKPETILYHVDLSLFDQTADVTAHERTSIEGIKLFYDRSPFVQSYIDSIEQRNKVKYLFQLYPYNGRAINILFHYIRTKRSMPSSVCGDGFLPLPVSKRDSLNTLKQYNKSMQSERKGVEIDIDKLNVIKRIVELTKAHDIELVFFRSPTFRYNVDRVGNSGAIFRSEIDAPFIDFMNDPIPILDDAKYWKNVTHVNNLGASIQTREMIKQLNEIGYDL